MAINYLNTVNLNKNSLDNARIQNLAVEPTADTPGQVYFNTVSQTLRITEQTGFSPDPVTYAWVSVSGDITSLIAGTDIDIDDEDGPTPAIIHADITRADSANTGEPSYGGTFAAVDSITTSATGHVTAVNVKTFTLPTIAYDLGKAAASADLVLSKDGTTQDTISFAGTASQIEINVATEDAYTFKFPDAGIVLPDGSTATTQASGDNSTKIATTAFVQASVTGLLEFKGGFDANTGTIVGGTTNLTKNDQPDTGDETVAIAVGDYYVVTADGNFFANAATPLTVGDSVIVQTAAIAGASTEGDFIVVQSDTDLATATTVGIGNVVPGASGTITAPYTNNDGTAILDVVDSTDLQKGAVIVAASTGISVGYASGTATITNTDTNADNTFSGTIGDGTLTSLPVTAATHGLGADSSSFIIQLVEVSSGETVYSDVTRGTSGLVTIDFAVAPAANAIRVLIQKIG